MERAHGMRASAHGQILVGLDARGGWERPLDWAVDQAVLEHRGLTIVHAVDSAESLWRDPSGHDVRIGVKEAPAPSQLLLDRARARALARAPELVVHQQLSSGTPRGALSTAAADAHLLVVGSRDRRGPWPLLLDSVGAAISRRPPCPTVIVHADHPGTVHRGVLVGVDDTGASQSALRFAFQQASLRRWPLTVLHVAPEPVLGVSGDDGQEHLHVANAIAGAGEDFPDVRVRAVIDHGDPSGSLLRAAKSMNLVVVGAHHGRAISDVLAGSVVAPVVHRARCPVAVVPSTPR